MVSGEFLQYKVMFITFRYGSILEGDKDLCKATLGQNKVIKIIGLTCEDCLSLVLRDRCS